MSPQLSKTLLHRIYWLSGSPCAGKTTISSAIAQAQNWQVYHCDEWEHAHRKRDVRIQLPHWYDYAQLTADALWLRPVDQHVKEALQAYQEQFTLIMADLVALLHQDERPLLYDGYVQFVKKVSGQITGKTLMIEQHTLFQAGAGGYHTFRIPALAVTTAGTLLAFAEGRKHGRGDAGEIDLVIKRSVDNGITWQPLQVVVTEPEMTCGNPCPVVDRDTGIIWLPFSKNLAAENEDRITAGKAVRTVWLTHSRDDGATWAPPREITAMVKRPNWTWYATGPTHGIQLQNGRLIIPCDHIVGQYFDRQRDPYHSHVIYSDDHGETWQIGGIVNEGTNECAVVELVDGGVYINCRNYVGGKRRAVAWSDDLGESFADFRWEETLVEPICQASLVRLSDKRTSDANRVLFANPASTSRERMTVRLSEDECRSWSAGKVLHEGPAAYSDLAVAADGAICCLYECGIESPYETLTLARFDRTWLTSERMDQ